MFKSAYCVIKSNSKLLIKVLSHVHPFTITVLQAIKFPIIIYKRFKLTVTISREPVFEKPKGTVRR